MTGIVTGIVTEIATEIVIEIPGPLPKKEEKEIESKPKSRDGPSTMPVKSHVSTVTVHTTSSLKTVKGSVVSKKIRSKGGVLWMISWTATGIGIVTGIETEIETTEIGIETTGIEIETTEIGIGIGIEIVQIEPKDSCGVRFTTWRKPR
jgi:hypothetical protein